MLSTDEKYMARCLHLAQFGGGYVSPNPMVGALVVCNDRIIGEGYHRRIGEAHAEPNAIASVTDKDLLPQSTLYVNLEPCSHYGKTPPCANLIVQKGIKRVVIGTLDPNPKVSGRGVEILREAGIEVIAGILENECRHLNRRFFTFQLQKRPYIILKWAQTQDGFIDHNRTDNTMHALKISNSITQQLTHKMRSENMAIMVSTNTVLLDNPSLTLRYWYGKSPLRIAIDRKDIIPESYIIKDGKVPTIIFSRKKSISKSNPEYIHIDDHDDNLPIILGELYNHDIHSILVEGGAKLIKSFIASGLWDEANIEISGISIGEGVAAPVLTNAVEVSRNIIDNHKWLHYFNPENPYPFV